MRSKSKSEISLFPDGKTKSLIEILVIVFLFVLSSYLVRKNILLRQMLRKHKENAC
ncbi:MAG: hypothetical protein AABX28_00925 [Nanoarchaeota archaeon]